MTRARGVCGTPGCPELNPCPHHTPKPWAGSTRRKRLPPGWSTRIQPAILRRDGHRCQADEHDPRCDGTATEVDHITRGDDHRPSNLRAMNHWCHQRKTLTEATTARAAVTPP